MVIHDYDDNSSFFLYHAESLAIFIPPGVIRFCSVTNKEALKHATCAPDSD